MEGEPAQKPAMYPMAHPMIGRELDSMGKTVDALHGKFQAVKDSHDSLETATERAMVGMKGGAELRRAMAKSKADIFVQRRLQKELDIEAVRLKHQHDGVAKHLENIIKPQVAKKTKDLEEDLAELKKAEGVQKHWDAASTEYHTEAIKAIEARTKGKKELDEAEMELERAQRAEKRARDVLEERQEEVTHNVEAYKYATARDKAATQLVKENQMQAASQKKGLDRTKMIYKMEKKQLDQALQKSDINLAKRKQKVADKIKADKEALASLTAQFKAWKNLQKEHAKMLAEERLQTADRLQDFSAVRKGLFDSASKSAGKKATLESGFDDSDWAWGKSAEDLEDLNFD